MQPWPPAAATKNLNQIGANPRLKVTYTLHSRNRMNERDLTMGDVLYVLSNGFVYEEGVPSTQDGFFKYCMETRTPNSNNKSVRVVVIADPDRIWIKIVTVMWADE
jgi:Domain of unknown function (DUF4258)